MFKFRNSNDEVKTTVKNNCTVWPENPENKEEDFKTESDGDTGWFFECRACKNSQCNGYVRK